MNPHDSAPTNGRPAALKPPDGRRHETVISLLTQRCAELRRGAAALKDENAELRLELRRLSRTHAASQRPEWSVDVLASWEVGLTVGRQAPAAARIALAGWLEPRVPRRIVEDVQLLASELVTNSVRHAEVEPGTSLVRVGVALSSGVLRLHVEDSGTTGTLAPRAPDLASGGGYGLNIVATLASQWGISRNGSTTVWADITWPSQTHGPAPDESRRAGQASSKPVMSVRPSASRNSSTKTS